MSLDNLPCLKAAIDQGVEQGVEKAINAYFESPQFDGLVADLLRQPKYKPFWFMKHMQARMLREDPAMDVSKAFKTAQRTYWLFLDDEKTHFGDPRFDWSKAGAETLIEEYEIADWEREA